jgi:hypothetical protein
MATLPIYMTYTPNFQSMAYHAISTLAHPQIRVCVLAAHATAPGTGDFRTPLWYHMLRKKIEFVSARMRELPVGTVVGLADVDIQIFDAAAVYATKTLLEASDAVLAAMAEKASDFVPGEATGDINSGFFLVKHTPQTAQMFDAILNTDFSQHYHGDQDVFNSYLREHAIAYRLLDPNVFANSCSMFMYNMVDPKDSRMIMHHATCCRSKKEKEIDLNRVRALRGLPLVDWSAVELTNPYIEQF